jgi:multidrug efflux pump subunit AcrA (membrane-fusion protein)
MKQDAMPPARSAPTESRSGSLVIDALRIITPLAIVVGGFVAFGALQSLKQEPQRVEEKSLAPLVETALVEPHQGGLDIQVDGVVVPYRELDISAEVSGRIAQKSALCRAGTYVKKGTPLIEIDSRDHQLEVDRLERELSQAAVMLKELDVEVKNTESLLQLAKEQLSLQRRELERQSSLAGRKVITDSDLDKTKRDELTAVNSAMTFSNQLQLLATRRSRLESARDLSQSMLEKAQLDLARTRVIAPIDGVIIREMVEADSYVQKGTSLVKLEDTAAVEVKCNLRMDDLYWLWAQENPNGAPQSPNPTRDYQIPQAPVSVFYELGGRRYLWRGTLSRFDGIGVDERTRTVPCRVLVAKPREVEIQRVEGEQAGAVGPPALVRGMYVTVRVHAQPSTTLLEVPQRAIQPGNKVWQVVDGKLAIRKVRVAESSGDLVLVYAEPNGLEPGMKLVSSPLAVATEGMAVRESREQAAE